MEESNNNYNNIATPFNVFDIVIIILSIYVLISLSISTFCHLSLQLSLLLDMIDDGICIIFLVDFIKCFHCCPV